MKLIHLISGGDVGGAKTHVLSLLNGLRKEHQVLLVCFMEGPFAQEARDLGIPTEVMPGRNLF
ncbi:MAG: glycosyltransferase family 1 protein, partial [Firmicutes bacterium]|nr:glycosyltransferase family 1 protein [Bacillota bacterium]